MATYDASGNPTSLDGATLEWENGRWLKSYSKGAVTANYVYDSNGIRVAKYTGNNEKFTGENRQYSTVDGRITSEAVSGGGASIESYNYRVYYRYDKDNSPIGFDLIKDGTTTSYTYEKNIQGDIVGILNDSTRRRVVTYTYDAWGKVTSVTGTDAETVGKYNSLRYRGYYYDTETGYYYLQSRYYDPGYKRFINADDPELITDLTQASVLGGNLFAYCENNAVMRSDPSGQWASNKHKDISKAAGFNSNIAEWSRKADDKGFASDSDYSAPFHARASALNIAKVLFNTAMDLKKNYSSYVMFCFDDSQNVDKKKCYVLNDCLKYRYKPNNSKSGNNKGSKGFLKKLNELRDIKKQYEALFGLALHTIQDYYAHVLSMSMDIYKRPNCRQVFRYYDTYYSTITGVDAEMTKYGFKRCSLEDDINVFPWRFKDAKNATNTFYTIYKKNKKIKKIEFQPLPSVLETVTRIKGNYKLVFGLYYSTINISY